MKELTSIFKALANERRLKIIKILTLDKELSVSEIAERIDLSLKSTSKHLLILERTGFLKNRMVSLNIFYSIDNSCGEAKQKLIKIIKDNK